MATPLGCFLYGGINATRVPFCDLWHLDPSDTVQAAAASKPGVAQWQACKCLPMCPFEHALGPDEAAASRSVLQSDRVAVGHDGAAAALTHDTQLIVRLEAAQYVRGCAARLRWPCEPRSCACVA